MAPAGIARIIHVNIPYKWKTPNVFIPETMPGWNAWLICFIVICTTLWFSRNAPNRINGMIRTIWTRARIHCTDWTMSRFCRNRRVNPMLITVVMPITGNNPEIIPRVSEKAIFSGVNPFFGKSRNGMSILLLMDSAIFKAINYLY